MLNGVARLSSRQIQLVQRPATRFPRRFASSNAEPRSGGSAFGYALAGVAGGGAVLLGAYSYYHFSGLKQIVSASQSFSRSVNDAKNQFAKISPSPSAALEYLRGVAKFYVAVIPGATGYVDSTFDHINELRNTHGNTVDGIIQEATEELKTILKDGQVDIVTALEIGEVLRRRGEQFSKLAAEVGQDALQPFFEAHPEIKEKLSEGWSDLRILASKSKLPETKKLAEDVANQIQEIFKQSYSPASIDKAGKLIHDKTEEIKALINKKSTVEGNMG